uniref:Uncharacterized protein n=1 Tax=Oryza brachyantha TaxID=4533 RepID=J3MQJ0_ORYBR
MKLLGVYELVIQIQLSQARLCHLTCYLKKMICRFQRTSGIGASFLKFWLNSSASNAPFFHSL